ncbi:NmrA family NAD(P)-binding protein [Daejeonella oryzae]|uniref:NmrA family NAD(P)-binding protein n=1 Tax=Daejeonella oryzae TaxID=1122943 RepID=UPI0004151CD9|nr:NmrA family NAD(P)-binding protein [Daejeonella oryzae]
MGEVIVVAGATGNLGERIVRELLSKGAEVRALVRSSSDAGKVNMLENSGVKVFKVNLLNAGEVALACQGASCVVSALAGLRDVIVDTQKVLADAAVLAGVPRFIPSDYCLDFTNLRDGQNRNLDERREFQQYIDKLPIAATSIFNGPFMDLLTGPMPMILFKYKRILYWGNADQSIDFTTMDDTAAFTANAALDSSSPRFLKIAGEQISARQMAVILSEVSGHHFKLFKAGGLGLLNLLIKVARTISPAEKELYPAWQGMQYMRDMFEGRARISHYDNDRYPGMHWTGLNKCFQSKRFLQSANKWF